MEPFGDQPGGDSMTPYDPRDDVVPDTCGECGDPILELMVRPLAEWSSETQSFCCDNPVCPRYRRLYSYSKTLQTTPQNLVPTQDEVHVKVQDRMRQEAERERLKNTACGVTPPESGLRYPSPEVCPVPGCTYDCDWYPGLMRHVKSHTTTELQEVRA